MELQNVKQQVERTCLCKYYEDTLNQVKDEHQKYVDKLKQKYETGIYELRIKQNASMNLDLFREKIFTDITERVLSFI